MSKYKVFLSNSIEVLQDEELIAEVNTYQEACSAINDYLKENGYSKESYWRFLMGSTATFVDFGSWSKFCAIVPCIPVEEMMK